VVPADVAERFAGTADDQDHALLVAEAMDGAILGWLHVHRPKLLVSPPSAEIGGLIVGSGSRRHGVGAALMAAAEEWARGAGCQLVCLRSNVIRTDAHAFYGLGYTDAKTSHTFVKADPGLGRGAWSDQATVPHGITDRHP
jgi:GNAT superfamily N-acetyltransferase